MVKPEIRKLLVLSTAHLPEKFFAPEGGVLWGTPHDVTEYGVLMWVPDDPVADQDDGDENPAFEVVQVQRFARGLGCDYVLFDRDGETVDGLPVWEW